MRLNCGGPLHSPTICALFLLIYLIIFFLFAAFRHTSIAPVEWRIILQDRSLGLTDILPASVRPHLLTSGSGDIAFCLAADARHTQRLILFLHLHPQPSTSRKGNRLWANPFRGQKYIILLLAHSSVCVSSRSTRQYLLMCAFTSQ